jgi:hypothetical protein
MWACAKGQRGFRRRSATRSLMGCHKPWVETHGYHRAVAPRPRGGPEDVYKDQVRSGGREMGVSGFVGKLFNDQRRPQKTVSRSTAWVRTHLCMPGELSDRWHAPHACAPPKWERRTGCFSEIRSRDLTTSCSTPCWPTAAPTDWNPKPWSSQPVKGDANEFLGIQAGRAVVVHHHS